MRSFLLIILFLITCTVQAQHYETYTPANGLVDARVNRMVQDQWGRLLFLTRDGVSIFDGQRITNYTAVNNKALGIVNGDIQYVDGRLLLGTFGGEWISCDRNGLSSSNTSLPRLTEISGVLPCGKDEFFIFSNNGIFRHTPSGFNQLRGRTSHDSVLLCFTGNRVLSGRYMIFNRWQNDKQVMYCLDTQSLLITDSMNIPSFTLVKGKDSLIYFTNDKGVSQLDPQVLKKGQLKTIAPSFQALLPKDTAIGNIFFDNHNALWLIGVANGCWRIDMKTGERKLYGTAEGLLPGVTSCFQDRENNLWFIAPGKGVQKLRQSRYEEFSAIGSPPGANIYYCNTDERGDLFYVTAKHTWLQKGTTAHQHSPAPAPMARPVYYWNSSSWTFGDHNTLISDKGKEISLRRGALGNAAFYPSSYGVIDSTGNLLISGTHASLIRRDLTVLPAPLPYFCDNAVMTEPGNYWYFCRNNDILNYRLVKDSMVLQSRITIKELSPRYAMHWNQDSFWVATRDFGIVLLSIRGNHYHELGRITRTSGLSNNFAEVLLRINSNQVAVGTASGLDIISINGKDTLIENVASRDNHFEAVTRVVADNTGTIYSLTEGSNLYRYNPTRTIGSGFNPQVWLHKIVVNGKPYTLQENSFNYLSNNFSFSVAAPSFIDSRNILYRFELDNGSGKWQQFSNKPDFDINNLQPGDYTLTVMVRFPGRIYPDKTISYHFSIHAPFWKTWWFILSLVLLTGTLIFLAIRGFYRKKIERQKQEIDKQQAVEKERNRISRDMHDDLGSGLTKIAILSEVVKKRWNEPEKAREQLEKIADSSRELVDNLQDIIWVLNPKNDTLESLAAYIREYALKYFESIDVTVQFDYPAQFRNTRLSEELRRNVFLTIKESFNNILKHAWCNTVKVSIEEEDSRIRIKLEDDGKGFDIQAVRPFANGLKNMQNRIEQHGGHYYIDSSPGKGTVTTLEFTA